MFLRRFLVLLLAAAAAGGIWKFGPGSEVDRQAFNFTARGFVNPPLFIKGEGSHDEPWRLESFTSVSSVDKRQSPVIVSLGDDVEGFFQSSPPAPIDMAVVLSNFQRLGAKKTAIAATLAWDSPDPIGFVALEKALDRFESLVLAAPLSRGAVSSPLPVPFRNASVPVSSIRGDVQSLPVINRIPVPNVVLGGEKSWAGFSNLESESGERQLPLMARWEDRVVFSFPVLVVLQRLEMSPADLDIKLGEYLRFGENGPAISIDRFGSLRMPVKVISAYKEIPAEQLIDGGDDLFPKEAPEPMILRDDRSSLDSATRNFSRYLAGTVAILASEEGTARQVSYPRLSQQWELGILGAWAFLLAVFFGKTRFRRLIAVLTLLCVVVTIQSLGFSILTMWLPGVPMLAALAVAAVAGVLFKEVDLDAVAVAAAPVGPPLPEKVEPSLEAQDEPQSVAEEEPETVISTPDPVVDTIVATPDEPKPSLKQKGPQQKAPQPKANKGKRKGKRPPRS